MVSMKSRAQEKAFHIAKRESEKEKRGKLRMLLIQRISTVSIYVDIFHKLDLYSMNDYIHYSRFNLRSIMILNRPESRRASWNELSWNT